MKSKQPHIYYISITKATPRGGGGRAGSAPDVIRSRCRPVLIASHSKSLAVNQIDHPVERNFSFILSSTIHQSSTLCMEMEILLRRSEERQTLSGSLT